MPKVNLEFAFSYSVSSISKYILYKTISQMSKDIRTLDRRIRKILREQVFVFQIDLINLLSQSQIKIKPKGHFT